MNRKTFFMRVFAILCVIAMLGTGICIGVNPETSYAEINVTKKLSHTMATLDDYESVMEQYIPRFSSRDDAEAAKQISYDSTNHAMKFTMAGWYNSAGGKIDITDVIQTIRTETASIDSDITIGISAELKGADRSGGFGYLKDNDTALDDTYISASFETMQKEMSLSDFEAAYSSANKIYVGFWSGGPDIYIRNLNVYYYTGEREEPIEMETGVTVPVGSTGLMLDSFGSGSNGKSSDYSGYQSGKLTTATDSLKYTGTENSDSNGWKKDITSYIHQGVSGDVVGASLRIKVTDWEKEENRANQAKLFIEVISSEGMKKASYPLDENGPNESANNLTNSTAEVGAGWLTKRLSGESAVEFESTDKIYLCATQKNAIQFYNEICLWGNFSSYKDVNDIRIKTPELNEEENKTIFTLENLSAQDKNLTIQIDHYSQNKASSVDEYNLVLQTGTEETELSLPAEKGSVIHISDAAGTKYVDSMKVGTYEWMGAWSSPQLVATGSNVPPDEGLSGNTYRQFVRVSTGGTQVRFRFSNLKGTTPLELKSVHIANQVSADSSEIDTATDTALTFHGQESVTIPAGETILSDTVEYKVEPLQKVAVSTYFGDVPTTITSHTGARCNNYFSVGNRVSDLYFGIAEKRVSWYFLQDMEIMSPEENEAVVCFGDSITDGYGTIPDQYQRWSDILAEKLQTNDKTKHLAVLNEGIGGNAIFGGLGDAAMNRFQRDVLEKTGAKYLVMLIGINDIGSATSLTLADRMKTEYQSMINKAHEKGMKVFLGTILPFKGNSYYSANEGPLREQIRQDINSWILAGHSGADEVIDFASAMASESDSEKMNSKYVNDYLHPNIDGYKYMGEMVYEAISQSFE